MGRGNVCVTGQYEGLYYIERDDYDVYRRDDPYADEEEHRLGRDVSLEEHQSGEWLYDDWGSSEEYDDIITCFVEKFTEMFPSFARPEDDKYTDRSREQYILMENRLFYIVEEDNEWSMAIKLVQKHDDYGEVLAGLQKRHYQRYLDGIKRCLLDRLPSIGTYGGAWTSGRIFREEVFA